MIGLGMSLSQGGASESASIAGRSSGGTSWTATTVGSITTPELIVLGTSRTTVLYLYIDNANDWNGTVGDYSLTDTTVTNLQTGASLTGQTYTFSVDGGAVGGLRVLTTGNNAFNESPLSLGSGKTVRITGNLTFSGYESLELTADHTY